MGILAAVKVQHGVEEQAASKTGPRELRSYLSMLADGLVQHAQQHGHATLYVVPRVIGDDEHPVSCDGVDSDTLETALSDLDTCKTMKEAEAVLRGKITGRAKVRGVKVTISKRMLAGSFVGFRVIRKEGTNNEVGIN